MDSSVELKMLQNAVFELGKHFDNFQEVVIQKLTSIEENWRQFNSVKESSKEVPVDLNDFRRPPPVGYVRVDTNMIHLGHGIWLPKSTYDNDVFTAGSSLGMFVKNIAVSVFGVEYLKSHSVKGKSSNKTKSVPRPAIDSTKALAIRDIFEFYLRTVQGVKETDVLDEVNTYEEYIRQKISDLNRPPRTKKVNPADKDNNSTRRPESKSTEDKNDVTQKRDSGRHSRHQAPLQVLLHAPGTPNTRNLQPQSQPKSSSGPSADKEGSSSESSSESEELRKSGSEDSSSSSSSEEEESSGADRSTEKQK